jgi:hypothetical protein
MVFAQQETVAIAGQTFLLPMPTEVPIVLRRFSFGQNQLEILPIAVAAIMAAV